MPQETIRAALVQERAPDLFPAQHQRGIGSCGPARGDPACDERYAATLSWIEAAKKAVDRAFDSARRRIVVE